MRDRQEVEAGVRGNRNYFANTRTIFDGSEDFLISIILEAYKSKKEVAVDGVRRLIARRHVAEKNINEIT